MEKKLKNTDIRLISLNGNIRPPVVENKSRNWALNGKNNSFYKYIIDRRNGSTTNSSILESFKDLVYGKGLTSTGVNTTDWYKLKSILRDKDLRMIVSDFVEFNEASKQIIKDRKGDLHSIKHLPKNLVVPSIVNEDNEIESYWVSRKL